jgi:hypothetical protein
MANLVGFQVHKINAFARIDMQDDEDPVEIDLARFTLTFAKNTIPTAHASVILGRSIVDGKVAEIHTLVDDLRVTLPIEIYLKVIPRAASTIDPVELWPAHYFRVFHGDLVSTGYTKDRERVSFNLGIAHWLVNTNSSSLLIGNTHTITPQQMNNLASFQLNQGASSNYFSIDGSAELFTTDNINEDFWGLALGPWLQQLCDLDILDDDGEDEDLQNNSEGLAALSRFEPFIYATGANPEGTYLYGVPLELPIASIVGADALSTGISEEIAQETFECFRSATLWDKLIAYGSNYEFSVIPLVNSALVVPQVDGQREPWVTIYGEEYNMIDVQSTQSRPVKGVRLFSGITSTDGSLGFGNAAASPPEFFGRYDNPDFPEGMIRYDNAPRWIANSVSASSFGPGAAAPFAARGSAMFPGLGLINAIDIPAVLAGATEIGDGLARAVYIREALRGRRGSLQGRLRFDIAPGSTIAIEGVEDQFVSSLTGKDGDLLYAEVQSVGITVDAESMLASTVFELMNVRTFAENEADSSSIDVHPLYEQTWRGAPLAENEEFRPEVIQIFEDEEEAD